MEIQMGDFFAFHHFIYYHPIREIDRGEPQTSKLDPKTRQQGHPPGKQATNLAEAILYHVITILHSAQEGCSLENFLPHIRIRNKLVCTNYRVYKCHSVRR